METVVLAYSGGLDTSCILVWLQEKGFQVVAFMANVGQEENFEEVEKKAKLLGAKKVIIKDLRKDFVEDYIWPAVQAGAIYEDRYLLGTALARPCIARALISVAEEEKASYISHGATGKGNDQLRFEFCCYALNPLLKVIAPWRMPEFYQRFSGRQDLLKYAKEKNIPVSATPKDPWSIDANIMHVSYESGVLEDPWCAPPNGLFQMTTDLLKTPDTPAVLEIEFKNGIPIKAKVKDGEWKERTPLKLFMYLNEIGSLHGIGKIDIVENRVIGIKSRGVYETPAGTILHIAHQDLEIFVLDKEVLKIKKYLSNQFSQQVYNGLWYSPECEFTLSCLQNSQSNVNGIVRVLLYKGHVHVMARYSPTSTYNQTLSSMDDLGDFTPIDADGFIKIGSIRLREHYLLKNSILQMD